MKRLMIIALAIGCVGMRAAENFEAESVVAADAAQPVSQDSAMFLEQLRQALGTKNDGAEEVRQVVDPSLEFYQQDDVDLEGAQDFDFEEEDVESNFMIDEPSHEQNVELSGEEMSGYFADV